jgi:hypothetical protein
MMTILRLSVVEGVDHCNQRSKAGRREDQRPRGEKRRRRISFSVTGRNHLRLAIGGLDDEMKFAISTGETDDF